MHEEGPTVGSRARERAKRTANILNMSVALDVSKNSGWLNDDASCRVERRGHTIGGARGAARETGVREATAAQAACARGGGGPSRVKAGGQSTCGAHQKHAGRGFDLGRVEGQRLVERIRLLPSRKEGTRCEARCAGREAGVRILCGAVPSQAVCMGKRPD